MSENSEEQTLDVAAQESVALSQIRDTSYQMANDLSARSADGVRGVGIDAVDIARCQTVVRRSPDLLERICGPGEVRPRDFREFARRWAIKEAVIKAVGGGLTPQHITVLHDQWGRPEVDEPAGRHIEVSVTDTDGVAIAIAIWYATATR